MDEGGGRGEVGEEGGGVEGQGPGGGGPPRGCRGQAEK